MNRLVTLILAVLAIATVGTGQDRLSITGIDATASHLIVPQARGIPLVRGMPQIDITGVRARVEILDQTATTRLEIKLHNAHTAQAEAILLLPVPDGAAATSYGTTTVSILTGAGFAPGDINYIPRRT